MLSLTFEVIHETNPSGGKIPMVRDKDGRKRRASVEEEALWVALQAAQQENAELRALLDQQQRKGKR